MAPALDVIQRDLHLKSTTLVILSLSVFLLGTAVVPLFTAPLSEFLGDRWSFSQLISSTSSSIPYMM